MSTEEKLKAAMAEIDPARKVVDPDAVLGASPDLCLMNMKHELKALMAWTASSWVNHAGDEDACRDFRSFYVCLTRIAEQLFYTMRDIHYNGTSRFYDEKGGE